MPRLPKGNEALSQNSALPGQYGLVNLDGCLFGPGYACGFHHAIRTNAGGANLNMLVPTINDGTDLLQIRLEHALRAVGGVADVVSPLGGLAADIALHGHRVFPQQIWIESFLFTFTTDN